MAVLCGGTAIVLNRLHDETLAEVAQSYRIALLALAD